MHPIIHQYKLRLTNLSQANRSLKLAKLSRRKDLDITDAAFINQLSSEEILQKIVAGRSVDLIKTLSARDEQTNLLDRRLNQLYREVNTIYEETGTDDLFLGYPFVEGRFLDGSIARCPLMLFPVRLLRDFQRKPRWRLEVPKDEDVSFNKTFFLAYEKFQQVRMTQEFWESRPEHQGDLQALLNTLYAFMQQHELQINFNPELFRYKVHSFPDKNNAMLENLPVGTLKLQPHAVLGIFPQSDSALLQDYEAIEHAAQDFDVERLLQIGAPDAELPYFREDERYFVTPVDQSQEEGLLRVKSGQSIVLHGPPGTGKSQVIINLVADALARGQRVLVCSQKRAALDVVFHRLSEIGLGRFSALVHDYRGDRSKIFRHIKRQIDDIEAFKSERLDLNLDKWVRDFRQDSRKIDEFNHFFDDLYKALTETTRFGLSPHQVYLMARPDIPLLPMKDHARNLDYDGLRALMSRLRELMDYREFFAADHPWRNRRPLHQYGFSGRDTLIGKLEGLDSAISKLHEAWERFPWPETRFDSTETLEAVVADYRKLESLLRLDGATEDYAAYEGEGLKMTFVRRKLDSLRKIFDHMANFQILDGFSMLLFGDLKERFEYYWSERRKFGRLFSLRYLKGRWYVKQILQKKGRRFKEEDIKALKKEFDVLDRLMTHYQSIEKYRFFNDLPLTDTPGQLQAWVVRKTRNLDVVKQVRAIKSLPQLLPRIVKKQLDTAHWAESLRHIAAVEDFLALHKATVGQWQPWLHPAQIAFLLEGIYDPAAATAYVTALRESFLRNFEDLRSLDDFLQQLQPVERQVVQELEAQIGALEDADVAGFIGQVENSFLLSWIELFEAEKPALAEVSSRRMPRRQAEFREKVAERQEKVVQLILRKLKDEILNNIEYNRLKNPVTYRGIAHQVGKSRRLWPVRKLVSEYWDEGLARLVPCWMASPESVAAIFPMVRDYFDLVIFDEASQCYVERALPVMLRGTHCVIAGDDKQLPPFDLYNVKVEDDEEAFFENEMAMEVESVLDLAKNVFTEAKLNWHYRSQEEELINFSNHAFYDGRLNIIPPAQPAAANMPPIEFLPVDGLWERNRNEAEAQRVVALVRTLVQRPDRPTIGIVTFNYHQKELIRDLLEAEIEALARSGEAEMLALLQATMYRQEAEEQQGLFVKNIENVQGDERDIIIFSVGYARNAAGRLVTHFGLLNQKGGENRLNVAVTRARHKIYVICSFDPNELNVVEALHDGPRLFKAYLQYARAISQGQMEAATQLLHTLNGGASAADVHAAGVLTGVQSYRRLADRIAEDLEGAGYHIVRDIGDTNYQLDLAIVDAEGNYLLGVECEGRNYFKGKSAKEREVYRVNLLEKRGWKVYRLWARNYMLDRKQELANILSSID